MRYLDQLTGRAVEEIPPDRTLLGRWRLDPEGGPAHLNGVEIALGDSLVPNRAGEWRLLSGDGSPSSRGSFRYPWFPCDQDLNAYLGLGDLLLPGDGEASTWIDWCDVSPIAPGLGDTIRPHSLESAIEQELGHLEAVCHRPHTHIRLEPERLRVERARRFDRNVYTRLAAHTEDWAQRRLTGVQPSHVLAQVREEQWDLYENRVAVRLLDGLADWLRERLGEVRRILQGVLDQLDDADLGTTFNWRRRDRLYRIWGEAGETKDQKALAERTCRRLEGLLYRVLGLMNTRLYREVSRHARVARELRMTNLLGSHDHYRGVARLWDQWSRHGFGNRLSPGQLYDRNQRLVSGFDAWCMLLVVRALAQLGWEPMDADLDQPLAPESRIELAGGYRVEWRPDGILIADEDQPRIRFVPLVHALDHTRPADVPELRGECAGAVADRREWTLILHPAVPAAEAGDALAGISDPPFPDVPGTLDWLRVSPLALDSVERVARALRWAMEAPRMLAYPPEFEDMLTDLPTGLSKSLDRGPNGHYRLRSPIGIPERRSLGLDRAVREAVAERDRLAAQQADVETELREARGDRRRMAELNRRKRELLPELGEVQEKVRGLTEFKQCFDRAQERLEDLARCPIAVCRGQGRFESREDGCFEATCQSCGTRWGVRKDPGGERVPVLIISELEDRGLPSDCTPERVDTTLGCDLLAMPDVDDQGGLHWRTPRATASMAVGKPDGPKTGSAFCAQPLEKVQISSH